MALSLRKIGKRFFITVNVIVALGFIATCLQPLLDPESFWFLGFFSLAFPYLFIILVVFVFFWLAANIPYSLISLFALGIGWKQIDVLFNVKQQPFSFQKKQNDLRVMSWNVKSFWGMDRNRRAQDRNAEKIFKIIEEADPDLLCIQEFGQYEDPNQNRNYVKQLRKHGFNHYVLSKDYRRSKAGYSSGVAIFSKLPLLETERVPFTSNPESILYADVILPNDTIRLFTTHLESFKFSGNDYRDIQKIKNTEDSLYEASLNIYSKMKRAYRNRAKQAKMVRRLLDESPYPVILACDMNDVPTSYVYWELKGNRADAFAEKGFGVGRTFLALAPTLRIDYILPDKRFFVSQFGIIQKRYSDHFPIVADLKLNDIAD